MNLRFCGDWGATLIREPSAQGLTLLELLLTLAIFSAVIGLLLNSFVQLKRQNEKIQTLLTLRQEARNLGNDPELHEVSYYLDTIGDPRLFKRREELYIDSDITEGDRSIVHPLSQRVISFDIKYYEGTKSEELEDWDSEDKKGSLPAGLKITIILEGEKGKTLKSEFHINIRPAMGPFVNWKT